MLFYALSNVAYYVSLHGPGADLEGGGVFKHSPSARRVRRRSAARRGLTLNSCQLMRHILVSLLQLS